MRQIFPDEPALPLPTVIQHEENPVEKHVALACSLSRKHAIQVLDGHIHTAEDDIRRLLTLVYNAGFENGVIAKDKINKL